jgi:hypothetical protein
MFDNYVMKFHLYCDMSFGWKNKKWTLVEMDMNESVFLSLVSNLFLKVGFNCNCDVILLGGHKLFYLWMFHFRLHMDLMFKC